MRLTRNERRLIAGTIQSCEENARRREAAGFPASAAQARAIAERSRNRLKERNS